MSVDSSSAATGRNPNVAALGRSRCGIGVPSGGKRAGSVGPDRYREAAEGPLDPSPPNPGVPIPSDPTPPAPPPDDVAGAQPAERSAQPADGPPPAGSAVPSLGR